MQHPEWIETKKECEVTESGNLITKRVTLERAHKRLEKKDVIDIFLRFIGLAAIFLPLWLFFQQQQLEWDKQKALFQLNIYSNTATELHSLINKPPGSAAFQESKNKIFYELYPKLILLNPAEVMDTFNLIKSIIEFSTIMSDGFKVSDSLYTAYDACLDSLLSKTGIQETGREHKNRLYEVSLYTQSELNNCLQRFTSLNDNTGRPYPFLKGYQERTSRLFKEMKNHADSTEAFCTAEDLDSLKNYEFRYFLIEHLGSRLYDTQRSLDNLRTDYKAYHIEILSKYTTILDSTMIKSNILLYNR